MKYEYKFINPKKQKGELKDDIQTWLVGYELPNGTDWRFVASIDGVLLFERVVDDAQFLNIKDTQNSGTTVRGER